MLTEVAISPDLFSGPSETTSNESYNLQIHEIARLFGKLERTCPYIVTDFVGDEWLERVKAAIDVLPPSAHVCRNPLQSLLQRLERLRIPRPRAQSRHNKSFEWREEVVQAHLTRCEIDYRLERQAFDLKEPKLKTIVLEDGCLEELQKHDRDSVDDVTYEKQRELFRKILRHAEWVSLSNRFAFSSEYKATEMIAEEFAEARNKYRKHETKCGRDGKPQVRPGIAAPRNIGKVKGKGEFIVVSQSKEGECAMEKRNREKMKGICGKEGIDLSLRQNRLSIVNRQAS